MKPIRALVVDDEELARERLISLLQPFQSVEVVAEAENGEEAIEKISELKPDLVFLDIQMPGCSGIEVAASLRSEAPRIIFCTAYDQYALEAFEVQALDYLLKPVNRARLAKALERVLGGSESGSGVEKVVSQAPPSRFLAKRANKFAVIPRQNVLYFHSEGGLTQLFTREGYFWMEPSLNDLELRLEGLDFFRVSRQDLVSLDAVSEVTPLIGGHGQLRLKNGQSLDVSRRRLKELIERLQGM